MGAGFDFFAGRPRPRLTGRTSRSLVFRFALGDSSAEESLSSPLTALVALRFRDDGVELGALATGEGADVRVEIAAVFSSWLPILLDTRANLLIVDASSCLEATSFDLTAGRRRFTAGAMVRIV